ncbi:hypothetical protein RE9425_36230 [Prescottella equi]|nr:hypothetical protein RE9425_36230 [Prescottella equi]
MPATEPGPSGTVAAYSAQPGPTRSAAGAAVPDIADVVGLCIIVVVLVAVAESLESSSEEHALEPSNAIETVAATARVRVFVIMGLPS